MKSLCRCLPFVFTLSAAGVAWTGCAEPTPTTPGTTPPGDEGSGRQWPLPDGSDETEPADGSVEHEGTLEYTPLPQTKSMEAYMGVEFTLHHADGEETVLGASEAVTHEALEAAAGKTVRVGCIPQEATPPDPQESAPIGPDGAPLDRPGQCVVQRLEELPAP
ncbi:MAG: hypothetical protein AAF799_39750 [Myxococcota bacterium]